MPTATVYNWFPALAVTGSLLIVRYYGTRYPVCMYSITRCSSNVPGRPSMSYCTRYHTRNCSYSLLSLAQLQGMHMNIQVHTSTSSICSEPSISRRTPSHHSIISSNIRYMTVTPFLAPPFFWYVLYSTVPGICTMLGFCATQMVK